MCDCSVRWSGRVIGVWKVEKLKVFKVKIYSMLCSYVTDMG